MFCPRISPNTPHAMALHLGAIAVPQIGAASKALGLHLPGVVLLPGAAGQG